MSHTPIDSGSSAALPAPPADGPQAFGLFGGSSADDYQYNYTYVDPLAMAQKVPFADLPTLSWLCKVIVQVLEIGYNRAAWSARATFAPASGAAGQAMMFSADEPEAHDRTLNLDHLGLGTVSLEHLPVIPTDPEALEALVKETDAAPAGAMSFAGEEEGPRGGFKAVLAIARKMISLKTIDPLRILHAVLSTVLGKSPTGRPTSIADYQRLFTTLPIPATAAIYQEDATFAWMRVAGFNAMVIKKVTTLDERFPVQEAHFRAAIHDREDTLARAHAEGRLYAVDYAALAEVENGNFPVGPKYCFAPRALFALPRGTGARRLAPVAIQCGQDPRSYPIFTPADGDAWLKAKTAVQCADANHHETISHLGRTHLLIEPFVVSTHRRLEDGHPVSLLLRPHFEGTLFINDAAQKALIVKGGQVDTAMAGTIAASRLLAVQSLATPYFNAGFLPADLDARGVTSPELEYPYRDDGLLVWNAIHGWVKGYLGLYYKSDADVAADAALQQWGAELVARDGGRLNGFGDQGDGALRTLAYLIDAVTMIIFTASAQHAAVNFAQAQIMTYAPGVPTATYRAAPLSIPDAALSPYLDMLPPLDMGMFQVEFLYLLGSVYYTRLGDYQRRWFRDPQVQAPLAAFQAELVKIEATVTERDARRLAPYPFFTPSQIPQSINI